MIKKADIFLLIGLIVLGLGTGFLTFSGSVTGSKVSVTVDGKPYGIYSLSEDQTIEIDRGGHVNHITIKDGTVQMSYSSCKNQRCVHEGAISRTKDSIVCLPNKVVVEILGDKNSGGDVDVISQ